MLPITNIKMSRQKTSPGIPLPPSSTYSNKYSTPARSVPLGTTTNVAAIARSINNMNISTGTSRTPSSTERPLRSTRITSLRTSSSSQDRSVCNFSLRFVRKIVI